MSITDVGKGHYLKEAMSSSKLSDKKFRNDEENYTRVVRYYSSY